MLSILIALVELAAASYFLCMTIHLMNQKDEFLALLFGLAANGFVVMACMSLARIW